MSGLKVLYRRTVLALLITCHSLGLYGQSKLPDDDQVKAVFLYNFSQFVEWPPTAFQDGDAPLVIGIAGEDPFGKYLEEVIDGEEIKGRPFTIRRFGPEEEVNGCHILFVNLSSPDQTIEMITSLKGQSTLTVSDQAGFLDAGGMIQFISAEDKILFQINQEASSAADLKISSKLLRLAEVVVLPNE